ncbi:UDP-glycosyltransferase [Quillaja saponaria]|uniref:UDP-glycosyltransferase n=1 Tax=Quillaja saponaria TaxID=32244 RepID=A0AAD7L9A2_QUISA|nr:UDP-glycosyltransferase [Quillaja saponaria]
MANTKHPHIFIFPFPAQGHILPMIDLTHQLSLSGFPITILVTPKNLPALDSLLSIHPLIQTLVLPFPSHPKLPAGVENVREVGSFGNIPIINALSKLQGPIIQWFTSQPSPPVAIISDFFLGWTSKIAYQLGIPRFAFYSSGAFLASVVNYCWQNIKAVRSKTIVELSDLPGSPSFKEDHLPSFHRLHKETDPDWEFAKDSVIANTFSWGCVFNSFEALEDPYLDYLTRTLGHKRVYGVGPLSLIGTQMVAPNPHPDSINALTWLDGCPDGSVLYVCFGSQKLLNREQMEGLANGLERSGIRFVWVVKTGTTQEEAEVIPDGFEDRVSGHGLVIKGWVQQVLILGHRAVGGFLSHCGWNSVLEGIVGGAMIIGWPMESDQFVNARLLVEDLGVAVKVCEGGETVPDSTKLGSEIAQSMSENSLQKVRAKKLRDEAIAAVNNGGSSSRALDGFIKVLALPKFDILHG